MARDLEAELEEIANDPQKASEFGIGCLVMIGVIVLLIVGSFVSTYFGSNTTQSPSRTTAPDPDAWRQRPSPELALGFAQQTVREQLRSPSTANFPSSMYSDRHTSVRYLGEQRYRIESWVDAQNAFGATMRVDYVAEVEQVQRDRWIVLDLQMDQR